ncbi:MAG: hypothetical protein AAFW68_09725 [Pseudomonadota bacterium]
MTRIREITCALFLSLSTPVEAASAEDDSDPERIVSGPRICALGGSPRFSGVSNIGPPSPEAVKLVRSITDKVGIGANFEVLAGDFSRPWRAFATIRNNQRYIVYDRKDFSWSKGQASWEDLWVMGHEVGHHVATHVVVDEYSQHEQELEADRFGGYALSRLGAPLSAALAIYSGDHPGTATHPGSARRRAAIKEGWLHGEAMKAAEGSGVCIKGWAGGKLNVDGSICRIARTCDGSQSLRLACQDYDGAWRWIK